MDIIIYTIIFFIVQLFLLPLYYLFFKWLFSKFNFKLKKTIRVLSTIISPIIFTILFYYPTYGMIYSYVRSKEFKSEIWINKPNERYKMVNDLIKHELVGKEKKDVLKMLGKNDASCGYLGTDKNICYLTNDPSSSMGIDHHELVIYFDEFNKVIRVTHEMI